MIEPQVTELAAQVGPDVNAPLPTASSLHTVAPADADNGKKTGLSWESEETKRKKQEEEERKKKLEEARKRLAPAKENMERGRFGALPTKDRPAHEVIDIGGNLTVEQALAKNPEFGQRIDWDRALYDRISDPLKTLRQMIKDGSADLSKLTRLQRVMLAKFDEYELRFRELDRKRSVTDRREKKKPENILVGDERIFHSGEEVIQALGFVQETEILVAHALGYEITNGGQDTLSYGLTNHPVDILEQAPLPGQTRQAVHDLAQRLGLSDPGQRIHRIAGAIFSASATGGAAGVGALIGTLTGNTALAGAIAGSGGGIALSAAGIAIGSWVISFDQPRAGESIRFNIQFNNDAPGDAGQRITDNPLAKRFSGLGTPNHLNANDYLVYAEKTRHGIYSRLGLRVEQHAIAPAAWNFNRLTLEQRGFIRSIGYDPNLASTFPVATQNTIRTMAGMGLDLWMVDLNPANLSTPGGTLNFDRKVRKNIQMLLTRRNANLPATQISSDISFRDFSGLSTAERHEIMLEAIDLAGVDICRDEADSVLQEIAVGSATDQKNRVGEVTEITTRAGQIENGAIVLHESGITPEKIREERRRLATAKDKVTAIQTNGQTITELDGKIKEKQQPLDEAENAYQQALSESGEQKPDTKDCTGKIKEHRQKIDTLQADIDTIDGELGKFNTTSGLYEPPTSANAMLHHWSAEVTRLTTSAKIKDQVSKGLYNARPYDDAKYQAAMSDYENLNNQLAEATKKMNAANQRQTDLNNRKTALVTEKNTAKTNITSAESAVQTKRDARDSIQRQVSLMEDRRKRAIEEIWKWVDPTNTQPHPPYGQEQYNTLFAEAQTAVEEIKKELKKQGIPLEGETVQINEEGKPVVVSKEDKEVAKGMRAIGTVCEAQTFSTKIEEIRQRKKDELQEFADPRTSHDAVLTHLFGAKAVSPTERAFYQRLLSKAGLVEAFFESEQLTDARATSFFAAEPEMLTAFRLSRENVVQMGRLVRDISERRQLYLAGETTAVNQIKILETQLKNLQSQNVRLLTPIYDKKIAPFLGENSVTTSEYFRVVMDRMRGNALEFNPFADAVQLAEMPPVHTGPDGSLILRGSDINPSDNSWINRGGTHWASPADYLVNGENIDLRVDTPINAAGQLGATIEVRAQTLGGVFNVLPNNQAQITGSPVEQELNNLGLLSYLYDAGGDKQADVDNVISEMLFGLTPLLPATRPDMADPADPDTIMMNAYLQNFGLTSEILDQLYGAGSPVATPIVPGVASIVTMEHINKKIKDAVLHIQGPTSPDTDTLATWLSTVDGTSYNFGGAEAGRLYRSLARALSENPSSVNARLLSDPTHGFDNVIDGEFTVLNNNGELRLYHQTAAGQIYTDTLQTILQLTSPGDRIIRYPGLDEATFNRLLEQVGKNAMEAMRQRTP